MQIDLGHILLALLVLVASGYSVFVATRVGDLEQELKRRGREIDRWRELVGQLRRMEAQQDFFAQFLREFPHLTRELDSRIRPRRVPGILLEIVRRTFQPTQAVVLIRRQATVADPDRSQRFVAAAVESPEGLVRRGAEIEFGRGELGLVAETQRCMDRSDFANLPPEDLKATRDGNLDGFDLELAAPMLVDGQTLGIIAFSGTDRHHMPQKEMLRLIAQMGAFTLRNVSTYTSMKSAADVDGLTGVLNKRVVSRELRQLVLQAERDRSEVSVFLFDIDHFKNYNDLNGHLAGDRLLKTLAHLVQDNIRAEDIFGRFGGEEFLVILPGKGTAEARKAAENIRRQIERHVFPHGHKQPQGRVTISGGVTTFPHHGRDAVHLLQAADEALYRAKDSGRNRVLGTGQ